MPRLSRLAIRSSLLYLVAGACLGALLLTGKGYPSVAAAPAWIDLHREVLLMGWLLQVALGVAYWILPRKGGRRPRRWLAAAGLGLLNGGIAAVIVGETAGPALLAACGRVVELAAALLFAAHAWPRVRTTLDPRA